MSITVDTTITLASGAATIDLTSVGGISGSGLEVSQFFFRPLGSSSMTFAKGATNGYDLGGSTNAFTVQAGGQLTLSGGGNLPTVSGTEKNIAVTGTGTESVAVIIIFA